MIVYFSSAVLSLSLIALLASVQVMHRGGYVNQAFYWFRFGMFLWLGLTCLCYAALKDVMPGLIAASAFSVIALLFLPKAFASLRSIKRESKNI